MKFDPVEFFNTFSNSIFFKIILLALVAAMFFRIVRTAIFGILANRKAYSTKSTKKKPPFFPAGRFWIIRHCLYAARISEKHRGFVDRNGFN